MTGTMTMTMTTPIAAEQARPTMHIDPSCTACGLCVITCPESALLPSPKRPEFIASRCNACQACLEVCPRDALTLGPRR